MSHQILPTPAKHSLKAAWIMWSIGAIFYTFQYVIRISPNAMMDELANHFHTNACQLGAINSCYYLGYALLQIPAGLILDRFGPRIPMFCALCCCALGMFLFQCSHSIAITAIGRTIMGIGAAFAFLSCAKIMVLWFPARYMPFLIGLTMLPATIGGAFGSAPLAHCVDMSSWQSVMQALMVVACALAILSIWKVKNTPLEKLNVDVDDLEQLNATIMQRFKTSLSNRYVLAILLYGFMTYVPLTGFGELWGTSYAKNVLAISKNKANEFIFLFLIGIGIGSLCYSVLLRIVRSYKFVLGFGAFSTMTLYLYMLMADDFSNMQLRIIYFLLGYFNSAQFLGFAYITSLVAKKMSGFITGLFNTILMITGVIMQPIMGRMLDTSSNCVAGVINFERSNYDMILWTIVGALMIAGASTFFLKELKHET